MNYNGELTLLWIEGVMILLGSIGMILYIFLGKDSKTNKIKFRYKSFKEVEKILWFAIIMACICIVVCSIPRFQDCFIKDFKEGQGVFQQYNVDVKNVFTNHIMIDNKRYNVPKGLILSDKYKGEECTFKYTKREKLILEIEFED